MDEQHGEKRSLSSGAQRDLALRSPDFERPENAELQSVR